MRSSRIIGIIIIVIVLFILNNVISDLSHTPLIKWMFKDGFSTGILRLAVFGFIGYAIVKKL